MLHYSLSTWKDNCYCSFTDVFVAITINIHNKVSFNIECFKNFLPFSSIYYLLYYYYFTVIKEGKLDRPKPE